MIFMLQKFYRFFLYNIKLRNKMLLVFLLFCTFPLLIFEISSSSRINHIITRQVKFSAEQMFDQSMLFLTTKMRRIENVSDAIISSDIRSTASAPNIFTILSQEPEYYDVKSQLEDMKYLSEYLKGFQDSTDVLKVRLYVPDQFLYAHENNNLFNFTNAANEEWYKRLVQENSKLLWNPPVYFANELENPVPILSLTRLIRDSGNYERNIGVLRIDVDEAGIRTILEGTNTVKDSVTFLYDAANTIVSTSGVEGLHSIGLDPSLLNRNMNIADKLIGYRHSHLIYSKNVPDSDWTMVTVIPLSGILSESKQLSNWLFLLLVVISAIACAFAFYLSRTMTKRISGLINRMKDIQKGDLSAMIRLQGKDEIGELNETFNYMVKRIQLMHQEQYELGLEMKSTELQSLQSQIKPHFLYNTLDLVHWMAQQKMTDEIEEVVQALAKFYRLTLNNGQDIVSIADELQHVRHYVQIQNTRFYNQILLRIELFEENQIYSIPKITLQPIVENAILHGILHKPSKVGIIIIKGQIRERELYLTVHDDGVGMNEEWLFKLRSGQAPVDSEVGGYGVRNVNERLKLYYGGEYGLSFYSEVGKGTTVEICIPANRLS